MPIDTAVIAGIAAEIDRLLPMKIDKIHQPYPDEFTFSGYGKGRSLKLLVSLNAQFGRMHLYGGEQENPAVPSAFCMLLRKHFSAAKLVNATVIPFERIVKLVFETYEPQDGLCWKTLWVEMTGRSANLILAAADGRIIDAWRRIAAKAGGREVSAGLSYELPSTGGRWQPVTLDAPEFVALLGQVPAGNPLEKFLLKHWHGVSSLALREIAGAAELTPETDCASIDSVMAEKLFNAFSGWAARIINADFEPVLLEDGRGPVDLSAFTLRYPPPKLTMRPVATFSEAVVALFDRPNEKQRFQEIHRNLNHKITQQLNKTCLKLEKQTAEAAAADQGDRWRIAGELLLAYGREVPRGATAASLPNHYEPGTETEITLDPARGVRENAQVYFKKYQKAKKGRLAIAVQLRRTQADLTYLQSLAALIANAQNPLDLALIREELESEGYLRAKPLPKSGRKKAAPAPPRQFQTPSGHQIFVGRNNLQNDRLTFKTAAPADWWFHTQKIPGSHVILKAQPGIEIDDATWNLACQLAAYFSQARQGTKLPVDYTQRKNVKKPPGAKPGYVIYDHFKTAIVTPDPVLLKEMGLELELE